MPQASAVMLWKSRSPQSYSVEPGLPIVSTLPTWRGALPLTLLWVKAGVSDRALTLCAKNSDHVESSAVKSGEVDPYHDRSTRPGSPTTSEGMTLDRRPPESTLA